MIYLIKFNFFSLTHQIGEHVILCFLRVRRSDGALFLCMELIVLMPFIPSRAHRRSTAARAERSQAFYASAHDLLCFTHHILREYILQRMHARSLLLPLHCLSMLFFCHSHFDRLVCYKTNSSLKKRLYPKSPY